MPDETVARRSVEEGFKGRENPRSLEVSLRNGVGNFFNVKKVAPLKFGVQGFPLEKSFSVKTTYNNDSQRL